MSPLPIEQEVIHHLRDGRGDLDLDIAPALRSRRKAMTAIKSMVTVLAAVWIMANGALAAEWRGIVPLQSTRKDVERLLGPAPNARSCHS